MKWGGIVMRGIDARECRLRWETKNAFYQMIEVSVE
jgi:hypothetical protein